MADYGAGDEAFKLMIVAYPSPSGASQAAQRLGELRRKWRERRSEEAGVTVFKDSRKLHSTLAVSGRFLVAAFRASDKKAAVETTRSALADLSS